MDKETNHLMATTVSPRLRLNYNTADISEYVIPPGNTVSTTNSKSWFPYPPSTITVPFTITGPLTYTYKLVEPITGEELRKWCEAFVADKLNFDA
jgi:hypothetical protein